MENIGERIKLARKGKKVTQQQLADFFNISRVSVTQWESDITQPGRDKIAGLAEFLGGDAEWYLTGKGSPPTANSVVSSKANSFSDEQDQSRPKPNASFPPKYQAFPQGMSVPLLGQSAGGPNGRFVLNGTEVGRVFCPPMLEGVEGAYAVMVFGTSMEPRYFAGETVWVNPHLPVRSGDDVIAQFVGDEEGLPADSYIKRFTSQSSKVLRLYQYNPDEGEQHDLEFDADTVFSVHKIVFKANT